MTADEIRNGMGATDDRLAAACAEIAAQLAELNHRLARLASGREELAVMATIQHP